MAVLSKADKMYRILQYTFQENEIKVKLYKSGKLKILQITDTTTGEKNRNS